MLKLILSITIIFMIKSCSENKDDHLTMISAEKIKKASVSQKTVSFTVSCTVPTPCYEFNKYTETQDGRDYYIKFYADHDENIICAQVVSSLDVYYKKSVKRSGEYYFHFLKHNGGSLDTVITFR